MNISTEDRFLIHALQLPQDERWQQMLTRMCTPALNWPTVCQRADAVGLGPVLYRQLGAMQEDLNITDDGLEVLKSNYLRNLAKNTYFGIELKRILKAFQDDGIAVILLKGAALAETVYHDPGARVYRDLDILVKKADIECARQILQRLDYVIQVTTDAQEHYRRNHHHLAPMIHSEKAVVVELHWQVDCRIHVDIDAWWKRSVPATICGRQVRVLGWGDMVLHLCLHLFFSGVARSSLRDMYDIYRVLQHAGRSIDWTLFDAEVQRYDLREQIYAVLQTTKSIMDPLGDQVVWPENLSANPSLVAQMESIVFSKDHRYSFPGSLLTIKTEKRWSKKVCLLWNRFFPDTTRMALRYGIAKSSWKLYLFYLFRPLQLIWRYARCIRHFLPSKLLTYNR